MEVEDFGITGPRIVSVNSFGYGGTNAHAIVQDVASCVKSAVPGISSVTSNQMNGNGHVSVQDKGCSNGTLNGHGSHLNHNGVNGVNGINGTNGTNGVEETKENVNGLSNGSTGTNGTSPPTSSPTRVFVLSAFDEKAVRTSAESLVTYLKKVQGNDEAYILDDMAYTLSERRTRFPFAAAVHASTTEELISVVTDGSFRGVRATKNAALGFVFTGQGAQWWAMGRELFGRFPVFSQSISAAGTHLKYLGADWDLRG